MIITSFKVLIENLKTVLLAIILIICSVNAHASTLVVGDNIEQIRLQDQFETPYASTIDTTHILFSRSMKGSNIIEQALIADATLYEIPNLIYIADISDMPSFVSRFFAMPSFKKYPFKLALDSEGSATQSLPSVDDQATLLLLDKGKIISINFFDSKELLREALH